MTHRAVFLCLYLFIQLVSVLVSNKTPIWVRFSFPPHLYAPYNLFFNKTVLAPQSASRCPLTAWQMVFLHSCNQHHRSFSLLFWEMMLAPCSRSGSDLKWQSVSAPLPRGQKSLFMRSDGGRSALINTHIWRKKKGLQGDSCGAELWPAAVSNGWFNPLNKTRCAKAGRTLITEWRYCNYQLQSEINSAHQVQGT